jgi:flagellar biosynthetic protein FliR
MLLTGAEITALVGTWLWPLFRIGAMVMAAPVFGARSVPVRIRLMLALAITMVTVPLLPSPPPVDLVSPQAVLLILQQILIGVLLGFTVNWCSVRWLPAARPSPCKWGWASR